MQDPAEGSNESQLALVGETEAQEVVETNRVFDDESEERQQRQRGDDPPGELAATVSDTTAAGEEAVTSTAEGETTAAEGAPPAAATDGQHLVQPQPQQQQQLIPTQPQQPGENGEFVNQGYLLWETSRTHWLRQPKSDTETSMSSGQTPRAAAIPVEVDDIIDVIFSPRWSHTGGDESPPERFPQNVPLPQMVDILVDLWEAEGLDV